MCFVCGTSFSSLPLSPTAAFWNRGFSCKRVERYDTKERHQNDPQAVSVLDIATYLGFVAYMGPYREVWLQSGSFGMRRRTADGMMLARFHTNTRIYHGTENGAFNLAEIRPGSYYSTYAGYPKLHVIGRSYFAGGIMKRNFIHGADRKPFPKPEVLEYHAVLSTGSKIATNHVYGNYYLLETWVSTCGPKLTECNELKECLQRGTKGHICKSDYFGHQIKPDYVSGAIIHRFARAEDMSLIGLAALTIKNDSAATALEDFRNARTLIDRVIGSSPEQQKPYHKTIQMLLAPRGRSEAELVHDEVVSWVSPVPTDTRIPVSDPHADDLATLRTLEELINAPPSTKEFPPYSLDYLTFLPLLNSATTYGSNAVLEESRHTLPVRAHWPLRNYDQLIAWNRALLVRVTKFFVGRKLAPLAEQLLTLAERSHRTGLEWSDIQRMQEIAMTMLKEMCKCDYVTSDVLSGTASFAYFGCDHVIAW